MKDVIPAIPEILNSHVLNSISTLPLLYKHSSCRFQVTRAEIATMAVAPTQARSLYRRFLRELPSRTPSILANPSPIQRDIRADISTTPPSSPQDASSASHRQRAEEAEQFIQYLKAQRMYLTLMERYNPGMNLNEEDRIRMTGRRVGMEMPEEFVKQGK